MSGIKRGFADRSKPHRAYHERGVELELGPYCRLSDRAPGLQNAMRQKLQLGETNSSPRYLFSSRRRVVTTLHFTDCRVFSLRSTTVWSEQVLHPAAANIRTHLR